VVPIAHGSLVVTQQVQLKRGRCRENGFIEGEKWFQLCFVEARRDIALMEPSQLNLAAGRTVT
jgi:hypothetical protein